MHCLLLLTALLMIDCQAEPPGSSGSPTWNPQRQDGQIQPATVEQQQKESVRQWDAVASPHGNSSQAGSSNPSLTVVPAQ